MPDDKKPGPRRNTPLQPLQTKKDPKANERNQRARRTRIRSRFGDNDSGKAWLE